MDGRSLDGILENKANKKKAKKVKRGKGKKKEMSLNICSYNVAGLKSKTESLKNEIKDMNITVFTIQEAHFQKKGKFQNGWS